MSLPKPPKIEILYPLLKIFFSKKYALSFDEKLFPFQEKTEELIKDASNSIPILFLERYLLEHFEAPFYSENLLKNLLEIQKISGYLFSFKKRTKLNFTFFKIDNFYFYPLFFGNLKDLFITLWRENVEFCALFSELDTLDTTFLKKCIQLTQKFNFTRLNQHAKEKVKPLFDLYLYHNGEHWEKKIKKTSLMLITTDNSHLEKSFPQGTPIFKDRVLNFYVAKKDTFPYLERYFKEERENSFGILYSEQLKEPPFSKINPFILGIASFEHARRAKRSYHLLDTFTLHVLADLYYEWEDLGSALKFYKISKPYTLQPIELALSEASIYFLLGDLDKAQTTLKSKLCGCIKEDPRIHYNLGIIYQQKENYERAEYHFYKAYLLDKESPLFRKKLLEFLWERERYKEMEDILAQIENLTLEDKVFLGKLAFLRKDYATALELFKAINDQTEKDGTTLFFLAWLYLYFKKEREVGEIFLRSAKEKLSERELNKLIEEFGLPL